MNGKLRVCRKCLPGQKNEEAFYEDLSRYIQLWNCSNEYLSCHLCCGILAWQKDCRY